MTEQETKILTNLANCIIDFEKLKPEIKFDRLQEIEYVRDYMNVALNSNDENLTKAACAIYFHFNEKEKLEDYLNRLIINPNH